MGALRTFPTLFLPLLIVACGGTRSMVATHDTVATSTGLRYIVLSPGTGQTAEKGMTLTADYAGYFPDGKLFDTSIDSIARAHHYDRGGAPFTPFSFVLGRGQVIKGWEEGFAADMKVGELRRLIVPPTLAYGVQGRTGIPPNSTLIFDVYLRDAKRSDTVTTMEGLRYIEARRGTGKRVERGMTVKVDYAGFLLDGRLFDTSIESVAQRHGFNRGGYPFEPIEFVVGKGQVIQGWDIGLTTDMMVGSKRRLIIPPALGYGQYGSGAIPPNATLIFDVEVVSAQ